MLKNITDCSIELKKQKDNSGIRTDLFDGFKGSLFSIIIRMKLKNKFNIDNNNLIIIQKRYFHKSIKNQCYWRTLFNKLSANQIQSIRMDKTINKNIKLNNKKIELAMNHPLVCIKSNNDFLCMAETSQQQGLVRRPLKIEEIKKCDISAFHKADKLIIKEFDGRYYVLAFWKFNSNEITEILEFKDIIKHMNLEEKEKFEFFIKNNINELYKNQIDISSFWNPETLLKNLVDYNIENNLINKEDFKKRSTID